MQKMILIAGTAEVNTRYLHDVLTDLADGGPAHLLLAVLPDQAGRALATVNEAAGWAVKNDVQLQLIHPAGQPLTGLPTSAELVQAEDVVEEVLTQLDVFASRHPEHVIHALAAFDESHDPTGDLVYTLLEQGHGVRSLTDGLDDFRLEHDPNESTPDEPVERVTADHAIPAARQAPVPTALAGVLAGETLANIHEGIKEAIRIIETLGAWANELDAAVGHYKAAAERTEPSKGEPKRAAVEEKVPAAPLSDDVPPF